MNDDEDYEVNVFVGRSMPYTLRYLQGLLLVRVEIDQVFLDQGILKMQMQTYRPLPISTGMTLA